MVWAITIVCLSLSCDVIPGVVGWFDDESECKQALHLIDVAWQPTMGVYQMACVTRAAI